jgi:uncharacterized protein with von Willebrand factor type A (vWA) domain
MKSWPAAPGWPGWSAAMPEPDLAVLVSRFGAALHAAGLPVGADRAEWFARAIVLARPGTTRELYWCARATIVFSPSQVEAFDRVFAAVFGGLVDPADDRGDPNAPTMDSPGEGPPGSSRTGAAHNGSPGIGASSGSTTSKSGKDSRDVEYPGLSSAAERLAQRDFAELSPDELLLLAAAMRRLTLATPQRRSRRRRRAPHGDRVDLRATLREAHRTGGDPLWLARHRPRAKPRRLVVLCDISGSMAPYARAMLQLLYCAASGSRAEIFTFATRLTRLTRVLAHARPAVALHRAGQAAPDWSGGTRIGAAVKEFNDRHGRRGMARGAVVLIISDGWETGDAAQLGREMAKLSQVAYRIVWVNPRTQSPRYRPLVGGMAAAWPYCDAVVSAHQLTELTDLLDALRAERHS